MTAVTAGARLAMLVMHDDATREYAYGPAQGLPDTKIGIFTQSLYDEAVKMLGERGLVEIIGLCGYYTMVSMTLNTFEFDLPEGEASELA